MEGADILVTATSAQAPLLKAAWMKPGAFYSHIGGWEDEYAVARQCEKIVCDACEIDDGRNGRFCSKECQQTVKHCAKCNMLIPINGPTHCEWCEKRNKLRCFNWFFNIIDDFVYFFFLFFRNIIIYYI